MSAGDIVALEVHSGFDPMPALLRAWCKGERVLLLSRDLPAAARAELCASAGVQRELTAERAATSEEHRGECSPAASILIASSGSSGQPRIIEVGLDALVASARLGATVIPFGSGDLWHASLAPHTIGGLMIHLRARVLGAAVRHASAPRSWSDLTGITHVSLVAPQLARLLDDSTPVPQSLKAIMLGGGPSSLALRTRALARGVPLYATYGMTETASQVATTALTATDTETLAGPPLAGITITIDARTGEVLIESPTLARGIVVDGALVPFTQPFHTRDVGSFDERGRLHIHGRLDAMFISGGRNIHPETIERALLDLPCVRAACVVAVAHEKWGMRPVAFVELSHAPTTSLRAQLNALLDAPLIPDAFFVLPSDEANRIKPQRARLAQRLMSGEHFEELL